MGILDMNFDDPKQLGLLNLAFGLLSQSGPSTTPVSLGQAFGKAGAQGLDAYQKGSDRQRENKMADLKLREFESQLAEQKRVRDFYGDMGKFMPSQATQALNTGAKAGSVGPTVENAARIDQMPIQNFDYQTMYQNMLNSGIPSLVQEGMKGLSKQEDSFTLKPGEKRFKGNKIVAEIAPEEKKLEIERMLDAAGVTDPVARAGFLRQAIAKQTTHSPGVNVTYGAPVAGVDAKGNPVFFQPTKNGGAPSIVQGVRPQGETGKPPTEFEAKAGLYFKSMQQASQTLDKIEQMGNPLPQFSEIAAPGETASNLIRNPERQSYVQAQRQWIDSINRVRSGANLPEIEYNRAVMTFFPQFGDSPANVKQKATSRSQEERAMSTAAGRALQPEQRQNANSLPKGWVVEEKP